MVWLDLSAVVAWSPRSATIRRWLRVVLLQLIPFDTMF
ncbi:hypothetical protein XGA_4564 [Xanthomonas hortorum ATCC 19865]|nr:hypothetical protein XGA_4564 [Xanthomonas hortorum ATCC 19865]